MITVIEHQNLLDIAIAQTGRVENAFAIALANGIDVTDTLVAGQQIVIPDNVDVDADVVRYYRGRGHNPATAAPVLIVEQNDYFPGLPGMLPLMLS